MNFKAAVEQTSQEEALILACEGTGNGSCDQYYPIETGFSQCPVCLKPLIKVLIGGREYLLNGDG